MLDPQDRRHATLVPPRRAVLEAARELFTEHGCVATPIGAIAARAGVSPETVYASYAPRRTRSGGGCCWS
jgi:AcrR family transcriptional regulator